MAISGSNVARFRCRFAVGQRARANEQNVHHDRLDREERDWLSGVRQSPVWDCNDRAHARNPEGCPRQLVLATWVFPRRRESRNGAEEHYAQARHDSEDRIAEDLPEHDSENGTTETEIVELRPAWCPVLQSKHSDHPRTENGTKDLAIDRILEEHSGKSDGVQARPDEPRCFRRLRLFPQDGADVGDESDNEQQTSENREYLFHRVLLLV